MEEMPELPSLGQEDGNDDNIFTRSYLESLATGDLIRLADSRGIDLPPDLDRVFIMEELLEFNSAGSSEPPQGDMLDAFIAEAVPLPRHYNITYIKVMIRDPLWAFVFWEIKAQDREHFEKAQGFDGYYLKVSLPEKFAEMKKSADEGAFTVPVKPDDTAWYLGLNSISEEDASRVGQNRFTVGICVSMKGEEIVLATSGPVKLPELSGLPSGVEKRRDIRENPLVRLSGYGEFPILRRNERLPRSKKSLTGNTGSK